MAAFCIQGEVFAVGYAAVVKEQAASPAECRGSKGGCVAASGDGFTVRGVERSQPRSAGAVARRNVGPPKIGRPGEVPAARPVPTRLQAGPVSMPARVTQVTRVPTCTGNRPGAGDLICPGAMTACQRPGEIALWGFSRVRDTATGAASAWARVTRPPFTCYSGAAPAAAPAAPAVPGAPPVVEVAPIDPRVFIPGMVDNDFQRLVILKATTSIQPANRTLVNADTIFYTETPRTYEIPDVVILGVPVHITARAQTYTWHFGDGETLTTDTPGARGEKEVTHVYETSAAVSPYVEVQWSGTYRIGDDPAVLTVNGTAQTQGPGVPLAVHEARTQLEADPR